MYIELIAVDRLGSGVRVSASFQKILRLMGQLRSNFGFNSRGNVLGGREIVQEGNCPGNNVFEGNVRRLYILGNVLHSAG